MIQKLSATVALLAVLYFGYQRWNEGQFRRKLEEYRQLKHSDAAKKLTEHSKEFAKPEVIKVTDGIYLAIGYGIANSIMVEAPDGIIIIDTMESIESAALIYKEFRKITSSPVKAIIYTHNHADHVSGALAFLNDTKGSHVEIWAHHTLLEDVRHTSTIVNAAYYKRAMRQFGTFVPQQPNAGIGIRLDVGGSTTRRFIAPNRFLVKEREDVTIAGLPLTLVHIPGETNDQIAVWYEEKGALFCADDVYKAFPNLYAIRGTPFRSLQKWKTSIDKMRALRPKHLVPSHTRPISGDKRILETLTTYRDSIQHVHDQTVRYLNRGDLPHDIALKVSLPPQLRDHPYMQEFYGTVAWSARGLFEGYMGWFSGDPVDLNPYSSKDHAAKLIALGGGPDAVLAKAEAALADGESQWALELTSALTLIDPSLTKAVDIKAKSLMNLAYGQISANGYNYYMTCAYEAMKQVDTNPKPNMLKGFMPDIPILDFFNILAMRVQAELCSDMDQLVAFNFTDTGVTLTIHLRNGILVTNDVLNEGLEPHITVTTTEEIWRSLVSGQKSVLSLIGDNFSIEGGILKFRDVMSCFETKIS